MLNVLQQPILLGGVQILQVLKEAVISKVFWINSMLCRLQQPQKKHLWINNLVRKDQCQTWKHRHTRRYSNTASVTEAVFSKINAKFQAIDIFFLKRTVVLCQKCYHYLVWYLSNVFYQNLHSFFTHYDYWLCRWY